MQPTTQNGSDDINDINNTTSSDTTAGGAAGSDADDDRLLGTVTNFDEARGLGEIHMDDSPAVFPFHCVSIADGSRTIAVGTKVTFDALLKLGRREAGDIRPV